MRKPENLTDAFVRSLKPEAIPYYQHDTNVTGLSLRVGAVSTGGVKSWSVRYRVGRHQRRITLGKYSDVSLADARAEGRRVIDAVRAGADPAISKQERRDADTVGDFAKTYIEKYAKPKNRSWKVDQSRLNIEVLPHWKYRLMKDITRRDVRDLLEDVAARPAPIVANRLRSLLHTFFNVAIERDVLEINPAAKTPRPGVEQQRDRVLTEDEIRAFWKATEAMPLEMRAGWQLRLLTAQRGGEVYGMRWADLDLNAAWWVIPSSSAKNKKTHRVPLSLSVVQLLTELRTREDERDAARLKKDPDATPGVYVLRNGRGKRQQAESAAQFQISDFRGHDLRRTAATSMASSGTSTEVIGKILNHSEKKNITFIYNRHSYDAEKRVALDAWARQLNSILEAKAGTILAFARG